MHRRVLLTTCLPNISALVPLGLTAQHPALAPLGLTVHLQQHNLLSIQIHRVKCGSYDTYASSIGIPLRTAPDFLTKLE